MPRCVTCRLHAPLCICDSIRSAAARIRDQARTRVVVVMQAKEARRSSNTGHLVPRLLPNAEIRRYGDQQRTDSLDDLLDSNSGIVQPPRTWLLFPEPNAPLVSVPRARARRRDAEVDSSGEREPHADERVTLVVPDGSWRQAIRMAHRDPVLSRLPRLALPPGGPALWTLRVSPHPGGLCTLESIARALGVLDGDDVRRELEVVLRAHQRATARMRRGG